MALRCLLVVIVLCTQGAVVLAASASPPGSAKFKKAQRRVAGRYIAVFKNARLAPAATIRDARQLARTYGVRLRNTYTASIRGFSFDGTEAQATSLSADVRIDFVEEDGEALPGQVQFSAPWGVDRVDQTALPLDQVYRFGETGNGVNIYVIDSGIEYSHPEFQGRAVAGADFVVPSTGGADCSGHGTSVAGAAGGLTYGVAKQAQLHSVRIFPCVGNATWETVISGINWVSQNHQDPAVANMSIQGGPSVAADMATRALIANGVTVVACAGNSNFDAVGSTPARVQEAITVGATDGNDARASFSNWGGVVDLFAPGESIVTATMGGGNGSVSGTSFSAPYTSGAAARYLQAYPAASPSQMRNWLVSQAVPVVTNPGAGTTNLLLYALAAAPTAVPVPISPGGTIGTLRPTYKWHPVDRATAYQVQVTDVATSQIVYSGIVTKPFFTPSPTQLLVSGQAYSWAVRAANDLGESLYSAPFFFTPVGCQ